MVKSSFSVRLSGSAPPRNEGVYCPRTRSDALWGWVCFPLLRLRCNDPWFMASSFALLLSGYVSGFSRLNLSATFLSELPCYIKSTSAITVANKRIAIDLSVISIQEF
jgi:hypothetical protein